MLVLEWALSVRNVSGLKKWFAVVKTILSMMFALIRTVCMPWSCSQRMTGLAVMASAAIQERAAGWSIISCQQGLCLWKTGLAASLTSVFFQAGSTANKRDHCEPAHVHFDCKLVHDYLPGRINRKLAGLPRANTSASRLWTLNVLSLLAGSTAFERDHERARTFDLSKFDRSLAGSQKARIFQLPKLDQTAMNGIANDCESSAEKRHGEEWSE